MGLKPQIVWTRLGNRDHPNVAKTIECSDGAETQDYQVGARTQDCLVKVGT